ncbi:MAG: twin-arginine translocation signal domain-containing protein [Desulforhopalus sp.]|nr:twin-arginine translocation signal domain-containing protein [Desulforhopalus sp.]
MVDSDYFNSLPPFEDETQTELSRRDFLAGSSIALTCLVATGAALSPLLDAKETPSVDELIQKHYKQLTLEDKKSIFARLEAEVK